jgi:hypothetical protein
MLFVVRAGSLVLVKKVKKAHPVRPVKQETTDLFKYEFFHRIGIVYFRFNSSAFWRLLLDG